MSENVNAFTSANFYGRPAKRPNAVVDAAANADVAANTSVGNDADTPVDPTVVETLRPAPDPATNFGAPLVKPAALDSTWDSCSDLSKPNWPGKKA
jgi:hypothetical protein